MRSCATVVIAVPSRVFKPAIQSVAANVHRMDPRTNPVVVWGTKGFASDSGDLLSDVAERVLGNTVVTATIAGPSFAYEVVRGMPTGFDLASTNADNIESIANLFRNQTSLVYTTDDMIGVQIGGPLKCDCHRRRHFRWSWIRDQYTGIADLEGFRGNESTQRGTRRQNRNTDGAIRYGRLATDLQRRLVAQPQAWTRTQ